MSITVNDVYEEKIGVYKLTNKVNLKVYIGSSVNLKRRINYHFKKLNENTHKNTELQKEWNIYGKENFTYEVLEIIESANDLPHREKFYIDEYKEMTSVYNKLDPVTDEYLKSRYKKEFVKTQNSQSERKVTRKYISDYLEENYKDKMIILHKHIDARVYYKKNQVDDWFFKNIENEDVRTDERLEEMLTRWYRKNGFSVVVSPILKKGLKDYGIENIPTEEVLIKQEMYTEMYEKHKTTKKKFTNKN